MARQKWAAIVMIGGLVACEKEGPAPAPESVQEEAVPVEPPVAAVEEEPVVEVVEPPPGPLTFVSWPGREELYTFDLMWLGGEREVALLAEPDPQAEVVDRAGWMDTEELRWQDTRVRVTEPRYYLLESPRELVGLAYDQSFEELEAEEIRLELEEGERLALYQYDGEGSCYLGARGLVVLSGCPEEGVRLEEAEPAEQAGERWRPRAQQWWVKVQGPRAAGWMRVDDAPVEVHVRQIEGYD
ncbi:hypothetical protein DL240_01360 [Lujinxingia litoralis]|uniref:Uncharacterized protein n=1 Tax=Lujinxingia litoralis TaxID=2211119 RepID=A0A328C8V8_9DELT|nr:hypothetical protein [Lujinxingia litoralis]RAL24885.1 hypothetical protein DL240_01360 [Lujinxingia litoralis]